MKHTNLFCFLTILVLLFAAPFAHAATYYVATAGNDANPGTQAQPFRTIAKGIVVSAANGDTVLLADGTYNERGLDFGTKNLVLQSTSNNPTACIMDCQQLGNGIFIRGGQTLATTISGLTIRNAVTVGGTFSGSFGSSTMYINSSSVTITNCIFMNNNSVGANGLMMVSGGSAAITNCTFTTTVAQAPSGTTVAVRGSGATLTNCTFSGNFCASLELSSGSSTVTNCSFTGNARNSGGGGAMRHSGGMATLTRCSFTNNAAWYGGAIHKNGGSLFVNQCVFIGNRATLEEQVGGGGGIFLEGGQMTVTNSLFANNTTAQYISLGGVRINGHSIYVESSDATLVNCTFLGGWTNEITTANLVEYNSTLTVVNSIIRGGDSPFSHGDIYTSGGTVSVTYSNTQRGFAGTGNITADPQFVNAAGGNYRLQSTSLCVNTGNAAAPNLPPSDLDSAPRILGSAPDMGAYEFWNSASGTWFVDKTLGNDSTGNGSPTAPYRTVTKAYTVAANGHKLYIKAGNYGTDKLPALPRMTKSLRLSNWLNTGLSRIGQP